MKIAVAGTGYVGLSMATLLAQHNQVMAVDIMPEKVEKINQRISPIQDEYIEKYFAGALSDRPVGIDAEELDRDIDPRLADKILSPTERLRYEAQPD